MDKNACVTSCNTLSKQLFGAYRELMHAGGWRAVGARFGISGGMAFRIAKDGYEPADPTIRVRLGLPTTAHVPVCRMCGEVHLKKGCTHKRRKEKRIFDMTPELLRWALENREEF
jgi:hypothetical protein